MKALKEKRVSLRSFLRRGLVILSLLALVFASCSESGGDEGSTTPSNGGPTNPPPVYVTDIKIVNHPNVESFQGALADLTGLVAEVKFSNSADYVTLRYGIDDDAKNFYVGFCDEAWDGYTNGPYKKLQLSYKGTTFQVPIDIPHIVKGDKFEFYQLDFLEWYSDERAKLGGTKYAVIFNEGWTGWGPNKGSAAKPNQEKRVLSEATSMYPKVDYKRASDGNALYVFIGEKAGHNTDDYLETTVKVDKYYEAKEVKYVDADWKAGDFRDDDVAAFFTDDAIDPNKVFDALKKSSVKFEVTYRDTKNNIGKTKSLTAYEFLENSRWYYEQRGLKSMTLGDYSTFMRDRIQSFDELVLPSNGTTSILNVGKGITEGETDELYETAWRVYLDYAPLPYNTQAGFLIEVPVQVWSFEGDVQSQRRVSGNPLLESDGATPVKAGFTAPGPGTRGEFLGIADRWELTAEYSNPRLGSNVRKSIPLTERMFFDGYGVASYMASEDVSMAQGALSVGNLSYGYGNDISTALTGGNTSWWNTSANFGKNSYLAANEPLKNFPLPLFYRGEALINTAREEEAEGILVDLIGK